MNVILSAYTHTHALDYTQFTISLDPRDLRWRKTAVQNGKHGRSNVLGKKTRAP